MIGSKGVDAQLVRKYVVGNFTTLKPLGPLSESHLTGLRDAMVNRKVAIEANLQRHSTEQLVQLVGFT